MKLSLDSRYTLAESYETANHRGSFLVRNGLTHVSESAITPLVREFLA